MLTKEQIEAFQGSVQPVMNILKTLHPHMTLVVTSERWEVVEGVAGGPYVESNPDDLHVCHECDGTGVRP